MFAMARSLRLAILKAKSKTTDQTSVHAVSRTRVTSMGGLYDAATLHALLSEIATGPSPMHIHEVLSDDMACIVFSPYS